MRLVQSLCIYHVTHPLNPHLERNKVYNTLYFHDYISTQNISIIIVIDQSHDSQIIWPYKTQYGMSIITFLKKCYFHWCLWPKVQRLNHIRGSWSLLKSYNWLGLVSVSCRRSVVLSGILWLPPPIKTYLANSDESGALRPINQLINKFCIQCFSFYNCVCYTFICIYPFLSLL